MSTTVIDHAPDHSHDHAHDHPHGWRRWLYATNHKDIGTLYLFFALTMLMVGGVLALKFGSQLALAALFSDMLRDAMLQQRNCALPTLLTAVPLSGERLAERGFNQALEIAKPLSRALGIALLPGAACRLRDTQAQAMLRPQERRKNIRHAFGVPAHAIDRIQGQHIGIVDDVITTGETLNELAATLKRFGAARVTNLVFARTGVH
jgi:ComF family protein